MRQTIVDILKKGNQELFHSSMIAWLMSEKGEHGIGRDFIERFAEKLSNTANGTSVLKNTLTTATEIVIHTEQKGKGSRYDIEIIVDGNRFMIENKTKSLGESTQLDSYNSENIKTLVALGICDVSFSAESKAKYPIITYYDIRDILNEIQCVNEYSIFIKHYLEYLSRELKLLDLMYNSFRKAEISLFTELKNTCEELSELGLFAENDVRFLNYFLLEKFFQEEMLTEYNNLKWHSNKNERSGVWFVPNLKDLNEFSYSTIIKSLAPSEKEDCNPYIHIELYKELGLVAGTKDEVGFIQLRCYDTEFVAKFVKTYEYNASERKPLKSNACYCVKRPLFRDDIIFCNLKKILLEFVGKFFVTGDPRQSDKNE